MRRTRADKDARAAAVPRLTVDDDARCGTFVHCWPIDYTDGDACACGECYLAHRNGRPIVTERSR